MKIIEAINRIDTLKPNNYTQSEKVTWLSIIDGLVKRNVIDPHEGSDEITFNGYDDDTSTETELLAEEPYDEMYILWLESKIDYSNGEYAKYNNSITGFNDRYTEYANAYHRTHMPKGQSIKYF